DGVARALGLARSVDLLRRTRATEAKLMGRDTLDNVLAALRGAYEVTGSSLDGATVVVVDDLVRSGGTLLEIQRILKIAGAGCVVGFVATVATRGLDVNWVPAKR